MLLSVTKGLAIATSLWAGGAMGAVSLMTIPAFLLGPHSIAVKQFKLLHSIGFVSQPPTTFVALLLHGFVAYRAYAAAAAAPALFGRVRGGAGGVSGAAVSWAVSAALTAVVLPFTFAVMEPTSQHLLAIAGTGEKREGGTEVAEKTEGLLRRWSSLNAVRSVLSVSAGLVGLWSVLGEAERVY
ncbi:hypothetical protein P8C59_006920 [Phyllachora maydis]|uniref:DUF1772-domain-containing protein n=1 Tax=Phyllachora maydis TaxID=1825666 RepID=A0AAD9MG24_9PEZI|nr:hypothetical protein P8C59_006920 [Phyllachora maydis]